MMRCLGLGLPGVTAGGWLAGQFPNEVIVWSFPLLGRRPKKREKKAAPVAVAAPLACFQMIANPWISGLWPLHSAMSGLCSYGQPGRYDPPSAPSPIRSLMLARTKRADWPNALASPLGSSQIHSRRTRKGSSPGAATLRLCESTASPVSDSVFVMSLVGMLPQNAIGTWDETVTQYQEPSKAPSRSMSADFSLDRLPKRRGGPIPC